MKRRRRGPRGSAVLNLTDANLIHWKAHPTNSDSAEHDVGREGSGGARQADPNLSLEEGYHECPVLKNTTTSPCHQNLCQTLTHQTTQYFRVHLSCGINDVG